MLAASTIAVGGPGLGTISTYLPAYLKSGLHLGQITVGVMFTAVMAAIVAALRRRLPGHATATPDTLQRRFLNTGSIIENDRRQTTIRLSRRTYSPILRQASLPDTITIPWWEGRMPRYQYDRPDRGPIRLVKIGVSWLRPPGPPVVEQPWYFSVICSYPPAPGRGSW